MTHCIQPGGSDGVHDWKRIPANPKAVSTRSQIRRMKKMDLQDVLRTSRLNATGTRDQLVLRLLEANSLSLPARRRLSTRTSLNTAPKRKKGRGDNTHEATSFYEPTDPAISVVQSMAPPSIDLNTTDKGNADKNNKKGNKIRPKSKNSNKESLSPTNTTPAENQTSTQNVREKLNDEVSLLDSNEAYILKVKGYYRINAAGTGVGILLQNAENDCLITARKYLAGLRGSSLAEFTALVMGIRYALNLGVKRLILETDNQVLYKQLTGAYAIENSDLNALYWKVMKFREADLECFDVRVIESNDMVTKLAMQAFAMGDSTPNMIQEIDTVGNDCGENGNPNQFPPKSDRDSISFVDPHFTYLLRFDGGVRGNPWGKAGCGMVLFNDMNEEIWCGWKYLDPMTNNMAEYHGILLGVLCALSLGIKKIRIEGDSDLIVNQLKGRNRVKSPNLHKLYQQVKTAVERFDEWDIKHIRRSENSRADWLVNHAIDTETSHGFEEEL